MRAIADLETPAVTIDMSLRDDSIQRVQRHLSKHALANRPHLKTHKIPALGTLHMQAGAAGS